MTDFLTHTAARALVDDLEAQIAHLDHVMSPTQAGTGAITDVGADTDGLTEPPDEETAMMAALITLLALLSAVVVLHVVIPRLDRGRPPTARHS